MREGGREVRAYLGGQALEERRRPLVLDEILDDRDTRHLLLEVGILYARLHRIQRRGDRYGRNGTSDGRDEVLCPSGLGVIRDAEGVFFRYRRCTK